MSSSDEKTLGECIGSVVTVEHGIRAQRSRTVLYSYIPIYWTLPDLLRVIFFADRTIPAALYSTARDAVETTAVVGCESGCKALGLLNCTARRIMDCTTARAVCKSVTGYRCCAGAVHRCCVSQIQVHLLVQTQPGAAPGVSTAKDSETTCRSITERNQVPKTVGAV